MKFVNHSNTQELAVKQVGKYAVYVSNNLDLDVLNDMKIFAFVQDTLKSKHPEEVFGTTCMGLMMVDCSSLNQVKKLGIFSVSSRQN